MRRPKNLKKISHLIWRLLKGATVSSIKTSERNCCVFSETWILSYILNFLKEAYPQNFFTFAPSSKTEFNRWICLRSIFICSFFKPWQNSGIFFVNCIYWNFWLKSIYWNVYSKLGQHCLGLFPASRGLNEQEDRDFHRHLMLSSDHVKPSWSQ